MPVTKKGWLAQRDILASNFADIKGGVIELSFHGMPQVVLGLEKPLSRGNVTLQPDDRYAELRMDMGH